MAASDSGLLQPALGNGIGLVPEFDDLLDRQAAVSAALASVFRGKLCDLILPNRKVTTFNKHQVIYNMGDGGAHPFLSPKRLRKGGNDKRRLVDVPCRALKEAYAQLTTLATDDTVHRLAKVLIGLATKLGQRSGPLVEIPTYFTQEEIAQMVAARRERVSTALNSLRRRGVVQYSTRGHLVLNVAALESRSG